MTTRRPILCAVIAALGCGPGHATSLPPGPTATVAPERPPASLPAAERRPAGPCLHALADYCGIGPCASYEERLFAPERHPKRRRTATCGDLRVIHLGDGFEAVHEYYDTGGHLVGARTRVDFPRPCFTGGSGDVYQYGVVPACPE